MSSGVNMVGINRKFELASVIQFARAALGVG